MSIVANLLDKAEKAQPETVSNSRWAHLFPVIRKLEGNGFSSWRAVGWLVEQAAVPAEKRRTCYHSYLGHKRRNSLK